VSAPATTRLLYESESFDVGEFRCVPSHPLWRELNDNIGPRPHLVFPRTSTYIDRGPSDRVLATPNHVVFYASNELYRRELHDPRGDLSVFVTVAPGLFDELAGGSRRPLGATEAETYLAVQLLVRHLRQEERADPLFVSETLHRVVADAASPRVGAHRAARPATLACHRELAETAKDMLARRLAEPLPLEELARQLHASPFHLARIFRDVTGFTLHGYRIHLRLRRSLEHLVEPDADVTWVAHALGFSSLSHFSGAFKRAFGLPPSSVRGEPRKIVEARLAAAL
jgi:AraC family transcriptional regulator